MNEFDQRWRTLAKNAGELSAESLPELPLGFAARVIAGSREVVRESWDDLLGTMGLRAVLVTACLCLVSGGGAFSEWYSFRIERPELEQSFTNELPWP